MFSLNLAKLKEIYKSIPSNYLYPISYIPYSVFCGKSYRNTFKELENQDFYSKDYLNKKLISYLNESICYTKFYKDYAKSKGLTKIRNVEEFFDFPIISKSQLEDDLEWFVDSRYLKSSYIVTTGGTTGKQTSLKMSNEAYGKEWAFVNHYLKSQGININSRRICLRGTNGIDPNSLIGFNHLYKELLISPFRINKNSIQENFKIINDYNASWIHGYPSSVSEFAKLLADENLSLPDIKHILLVSEKVYPEQLKNLSETFDSKILTFYGMTERVIFAPLVNDCLVPNRLYGVTEEINDELVGTGFINKATRLIRYKTGDEAEVTKSSDGFVDKITQVKGRWGKEYLLGVNGVKITMTSLNIHSDSLVNVIKYQFSQNKKGFCDLLIQPSPKFSNGEELKIANEFQVKVGNELIFTPRLVKNIPLTKRGKHSFIVSNL